MKKIILKSTIFCTIFLIILIILSHIVVPKNNSKEAGMEDELANGILAEPENTIDVLVVGDSESYSSYVPREIWNEYGITSYVCGNPKQPLSRSLSFIYKTFKTQKPKIVMLETNTIYRRRSIMYPLYEVSDNILPIFKYHDRWKTLTKNDFFGKVDYTTIQDSKGYYYSDIIKSSKPRKYMRRTKNEHKIPRSNKLYIKIMKKYCEKNGAKLVFYSAPSSKNWTYEKHNGVQALADSLGIEFIDLNLKINEININWNEDSRDKGDHLNYNGAIKVTKYLGKYLYEKNILTDHRGDPNYQEWNKNSN